MADNLGVNQTSYSSPEEGIDFPTMAKKIVSDLISYEVNTVTGAMDYKCETYVVWFAFVLGGWKALVSTSIPDGRYYEVTYSKAKSETYVDVYQKLKQHVLSNV